MGTASLQAPARPRTMAVVGGHGWLGQTVVATARQHDDLQVTVVSRDDIAGTGSTGWFDDESLAAATKGCDVVINAAGCTSGSPDEHAAANVQLPERLAALAADQGWQLVHLGSAAEYGFAARATGSGLISEDHPCMPTSLYGTSKLAGTEAVLGWRARGAPAVVARIFNVVDPNLPADNPVAGIVRQVEQAAVASATTAGPHHVEIGDPTTTRDLCPRARVAELIVALAMHPPDQPLVNVCSGRAISFGALAYDVADRLGARIAVRDLHWPRGGRVVGDPSRLRSLLSTPAATQIDDPATVLVRPPRSDRPRSPATKPDASGQENQHERSANQPDEGQA
jgi:nucleoside-diphosphate-sugar epimerase